MFHLNINVMIVDFEDIRKNLPNGENMGGVAQVVYYARHEDVAVWPTRPSSGAGVTLAKMGELVGNLVMKEGKFFRRLYVTDDEGKLDIEGVGERDGKSFVMKLRVYHPGLNSRLLGFVNLSKNENLVFAVPDNNGGMFLLGDEMRAAVLDSIDGMTTGQKTEERPGAGLVFAYKTANVFCYKGVVPLTDVVIPEPEPEPEPGGKVMACCPDGVKNYFAISSATSLSIEKAYPVAVGDKAVYTIDMIPGGKGTVFAVARNNIFYLSLGYTGTQITIMCYHAEKSFRVAQASTVDNTGKRVRMKMTVTNNATPGLELVINGVTESLSVADVTGTDLFRVLENSFYLFKNVQFDVAEFGNCKLISLKIEQTVQGVSKNPVLWDFTGVNFVEQLKNKATGGADFDLVATNVDDINQVVKEITIGDVPEPEVGVMACCPDGVDDYFVIKTPTAANVDLLFPQNGQEILYTLDIVPGEGAAVFCLGRKDLCSLHLVYNGTMIVLKAFVDGVSYGAMLTAKVDNTEKRVLLKLSYAKADNNPILKLHINGMEETLNMADVSGSMPSQPASDFFCLFRDDSESEPMFGRCKLVSFGVERIVSGVKTPLLLWDFEGANGVERLKNKVSGSDAYDLVAKNVTDINGVVKRIVVEDLPVITESVIACCPDGVDDYLSIETNALSVIALFPVSNGDKAIYTFDMIPGAGCVLFFNKGTSFLLGVIYDGCGLMVVVYAGNKGYLCSETPEPTFEDVRVTMRIELSISGDLPVLEVYLNDVKVNSPLVENSGLQAPTGDKFLLLSDADRSFFAGKLFSLSVSKSKDSSDIVRSAFWDFSGETDAERLKNKISSYYKLTAHGVENMSEFIKEVTV